MSIQAATQVDAGCVATGDSSSLSVISNVSSPSENVIFFEGDCVSVLGVVKSAPHSFHAVRFVTFHFRCFAA